MGTEEKIMESNKIKWSLRDAEVFQQSESGSALCFVLRGKKENFAALFLLLLRFSMFCGDSCTDHASSLSFLGDVTLKLQCKN